MTVCIQGNNNQEFNKTKSKKQTPNKKKIWQKEGNLTEMTKPTVSMIRITLVTR
jgi:hypothetical protein